MNICVHVSVWIYVFTSLPCGGITESYGILGVHWKDWCWSWSSNTLATSCEELTHWKRPWCWEGLGAGGEGMTEDEMAGWHHRLNGHEFEWTPGAGDGQGGLVCCISWGCKELDTTERLNWTELMATVCLFLFFWPCRVKHGILVPWPGIKLVPPAWEHRVLTTGLPGKSTLCLTVWGTAKPFSRVTTV